jgi:membrane fusion protein (multidrug efflux system)
MTNRLPVFFVLALLPLAACGRGSSADPAASAPRGVPVRTAVVVQRDLADDLVLTGTLRPRAQVQIVAEVPARLLRVLKDEGARVAKDETLAVLDATDYRLALDRAKAALAVAEANRAHALAEKDRADNLLKTGGITDKDHLAAQVGLQVAQAALSQAKAEVAIAAQQHARCQVKAPFSGRIAKRFADPGAMLALGTPIFTLVDDSVLEFRGSLPSAEYGRVRVEATVEIGVDALPDLRAKGRIVRVTPLVDERTRSFEVVAEVPGQKALAGGLFARARIRLGTVKDAVVVPPSALMRDGTQPDRADVFVVKGDKAERVIVSLGVEQADRIQVTRGLAAGDVVVLDAPTALGAGMQVDVQNGGKR